MSDLGGGGGGSRAFNGGARIEGPVPVSATGTASLKTPRDIMKARNEREARQQQLQREEEQRRQADDRRRGAERRATGMSAPVARFSQTSSQYSPDVSAQQGGFDASTERRSSRTAGGVAGANVLGEPTGRASLESSKFRGPTVTQQNQPRTAPTTAGAARRTQASQSSPRPAPQSTTAGANPGASAQAPTSATAASRNTQSSFPHAFERWETLSSHWEGLTSYWLHKLEQNTEEIRGTVPNASTLNRQITDLSAAGANLFHAVVELQRLRASSERKFQRWFFETRAENERNNEEYAKLQKQLRAERQARDDTTRQQAEHSIAIENAKNEVSEVRRELGIAKEEARRAWEELGRRNQESLDTAQSLKEGRVTLVSGVQVVPYFGGPASRTGSLSLGQQRPTTRDGQPGYGAVGMAGLAGLQHLDDERQYYRQEVASPTNTDPFTEHARQQPLHLEGGTQSLAQGTYYPIGGTPGSAATSSTTVPAPSPYQPGTSPSQQRSVQPDVTAAEAQRFYQQAGPSTSLHSGGSSSQNIPAPTARTQPAPRGEGRSEERSEISYVDTLSEHDTEYAVDARGNVRLDEHGRPMVVRKGPVRSSESEDDFDTEAAVRRERELAQRYGSTLIPEAPSVPGTSAQAMATYTPTSQPDYEGGDYEGYQQYLPRHHHPTRLSDVLEEEEERSSRRTAGD